MNSLELRNVTKKFGSIVAVDAVGLEVLDGELLVIVGPSGCGKTTVLRLIAGLENLDAGRIYHDKTDWTDVSPQSRDVAMVFQHYALYPQRSVRENIEYPLKLRRMIPSERLARLQHVSDLLGIEALWDRKPRQLSGGEAQRVALARALVREPACFLLDEPLSNLDAQLRARARSEIKRIQRALNVTTLYVTHDQEEAIALGDRIAIMNKGRLVQVGTAERLFEVPATSFVAGFFGKPPMNLFDAVVAGKDEIGPVVGLCEPGGNDPKLMIHADRQFAMQQSIKVGIRAEDIRLEGEVGKTSLTWNIEGVVVLVDGLEPECTVHCDTQIGPILLRSQRKLPIGTSLTLRSDGSKAHYFDVQTGMRIE